MDDLVPGEEEKQPFNLPDLSVLFIPGHVTVDLIFPYTILLLPLACSKPSLLTLHLCLTLRRGAVLPTQPSPDKRTAGSWVAPVCIHGVSLFLLRLQGGYSAQLSLSKPSRKADDSWPWLCLSCKPLNPTGASLSP